MNDLVTIVQPRTKIKAHSSPIMEEQLGLLPRRRGWAREASNNRGIAATGLHTQICDRVGCAYQQEEEQDLVDLLAFNCA